jgi:hypothetical protein
MQARRIGSLDVSVVGLGCMAADPLKAGLSVPGYNSYVVISSGRSFKSLK